jgi:hypothetical protein
MNKLILLWNYIYKLNHISINVIIFIKNIFYEPHI